MKKKMTWRWWSGGGVISIAVALGCATAIDFKAKTDQVQTKPDNINHGHTHEHSGGHAHDGATQKPKRGLAGAQGEEAPHNGGKVRMPVTASFDGEPSISISRDSVVQVMIMADADIQRIQGGIEGLDGLSGLISESLGFTEIAAGETKIVEVRLPAKTGRIVIRILGRVGSPEGETRMMSTSLELRVVNPKDVSASQTRKSSADMTNGPVTDSTGQVVRPMEAAE